MRGNAMTTMTAKLALALLAASATACTTEAVEAPTPEEKPPEEVPEAYAPPAVWGAPTLEDINPDPDVVEVVLTAAAHAWVVDGKTVDGAAYNGSVPGPLVQAKLGDEVIVHFQNDLDEPTTVHWHGLRISDQMDGSPRVADPVPPGGSFEYRFTPPEAASYWYHPHVNAHQQIERGLAGTLIVHDPADPQFDLERFIVLDDILLNNDGSMPPPLASHPEIMHGRTGNYLLTNGQDAELVTAEATQGQIERWRVVNTANARTMKVTVEGATMRLIGTDGGLLPEPTWATELVIPVGQRYDLEISYEQAGVATMQSHVLALDANDNVVEIPLQVFSVDVAPGEPVQAWPVYEGKQLPDRAPEQTAQLRFNAVQNSLGGISWMINEQSHGTDPLFTFQEGQTVHIELKNEAGPEHPFHLHGQFFQIDDVTQPGLKDTVLVPGMATVNIVAYMDNPGHWMAHCHILEHAELGMMSEIVVTPSE